ncbi:alpha/beta fold hydrolase [uncultured Roseobacter sp.]|uniref:alpha/beta hydrolase n=1 Tax=uncultured Roseobacter sp. TaxID=114847 RepID=UPI0026351432|nr:alpha/beta fold hydrolase [uncultured Roseobacter sp.]
MRVVTLAVTSLLAALSGAASRAETVAIPDAREAVVQVISRGEGADPALIVGLHGYGASEPQIATLLPVELDFPHVYVAVRAPLALEDGGYAWFRFAAEAGGIVIAPGAVERAVDDLATLLPRIAEATGAASDDIHVVGYSQGGALALALALDRPEAVASVAAFAGALPGDLATPQATAPLPVLAAHGRLDPLISEQDIALTRAMLAAAGRRVTPFDEGVPHVVGNAGRLRLQIWLADRLAD